MSEFTSRVALVTGAASGIGAAIAKHLARQGAKVVVTDVDPTGIDDVVQAILAAGGDAAGIRQDVSRREDAAAAVDFAVQTYGGLHYAVNNAGVGGQTDALGETDLDAWERTVAVDLHGIAYGMHAQLPVIEQHGGGAIVNVGSIHSAVATAVGNSAYTTAKHGLVGLTRQTGVDYARRGIRVNAVGPAYIGTPLLENLHRFGLYTLLTSTGGWDTGRAVTTGIAIVVLGPAVLTTLRRASRRAVVLPS